MPSLTRLRATTAAAAAVFLLGACGGPEQAAPAPQSVLVTRANAASDESTAFAGQVIAREESPLAFRVAGKLVSLRADVGDVVRTNQILGTLDTGDFQAQARAAQAQLEAAQAELGRARADQARFAALAEGQMVSRSALDAQNAAAVAAQGRVNAASASRDLASNQAAHAQLRAPAPGVISSRNAEIGQVVGAGQAVFTLAVDGPREVEFALPEGGVAVRQGQPVRVSVWSQPGVSWPGVVREIAPAADAASRTFAARATVDAPDAALQIGQSARVHLPADGKAPLRLPMTALQRAGERTAVFVVDPATSTLKLQPVRVGKYASEQVTVLEGVGPRDWVVSAGGHLLRAGQKVRPVDRENRPVALK
ncbi:MAG: efflux RND transporter periplasmic adaptor subunit [Pseudomonadota bacterium]|nr:efflux RND transporter periplasmic adaptor subunit [Pseudomonadota bacterium]